jgi:PAS domain S-box-containing protein
MTKKAETRKSKTGSGITNGGNRKDSSGRSESGNQKNNQSPFPPPIHKKTETGQTGSGEAGGTLRSIKGGRDDRLSAVNGVQEEMFFLGDALDSYRVLAEEMNQAAAMLDADGAILYCNSPFASLLETPLQKIIGSPMETFVADETLQVFNRFLEQSLNDKDKREVALKYQSGRSLQVLLSGRGLSLGTVAGISIVATLSERAAVNVSGTEPHVPGKEHGHAELYDFAPIGCFTLDRSGVIKEVNIAGARLLGAEKASFFNKPFTVLIPDPNDKAVFTRHREKVLAGSGSQACDLRLSRNDGSVFYAQLQTVEAIDCDPGSVRTAVLDISERKQVERALQENEEKYRTLFENMTASFALSEMILDPEGRPCDYRYLEVNKAYEKLSGVSRERILSKTAMERNASLEPSWLEKFASVAANGEPMLFEHYVSHLGKWLEVYVYSPRKGNFACLINDVTERERIEKALQESEERFRVSLSSVPITVATLDPDLRYTWIYNARNGYTPNDVIGKRADELISPADAAETLDLQREVLESGVGMRREISGETNGVKWAYDAVAEPLRNEKGQITGLTWVVIDITERKRFECQLVQLKDELENEIQDMNLLHALSTRCIEGDDFKSLIQEIMDAAIAITGANKGMLQLFDPPAKEMKIHAHRHFSPAFLKKCEQGEGGETPLLGTESKRFSRLMLEDIAGAVQQDRAIGLLLAEGVRAVQSTPIIGSNGVLLGFILTYFNGVHAAAERELRIMDILGRQAADIVERKHAEDALQKNEDRLREYVKLLEYAPVMVRNMMDEILLWNSGMEKMYGFSAAEAIGQTTHSLLQTEFSHPPERILDDLYREGRWEGELKHIAHNGRPIIVTSLWVLHKNTAGKPTAIIEVNTDITERRRAEEELKKAHTELERRAAELDAVNRELEAFSYTVSHDLKAPLWGVEGFTRALLEDYSDKLDATGKDYLKRVNSASLRMKQLIEALLNMARLTAGEVQENVVDMSALAQVIIHELRKQEPYRQADILIAEKMRVRGDATMLQVMLQNLLSNAWKFTSKREKTTIEFGVEARDLRNIYFIRDNGAGFDMQFAERIFMPFKRFHANSEFPGVGIGLATADRIIKRHNGRIWAESEPGKGTVFYFSL